MKLRESLHIQNRHWSLLQKQDSDGQVFRTQFTEMKQHLNSSRLILTLLGPRRVGKTTLMRQFINFLIYENDIDPIDVKYFSFDEHQEEPYEILKEYASEFGFQLHERRLFIFFDEVQYISKWASKIKVLYDQFQEFRFFLSGSSSLDLSRGNESLAGREYVLKIGPLSFDEYLSFKKLTLRNQKMLSDEYTKYMKQQLPALVLHNENPIEYVRALCNKIIEFDIPRLFNVTLIPKLKELFELICKNPGEILYYTHIARDLDLDRRTVEDYLLYLEESLLIRKLLNYSGSARKTLRRGKRFYPYFANLHLYTSPFVPDFSRQAETEVAEKLDAKYFWNEQRREVDFIIGHNLATGVEVKMKNYIGIRDIRGLSDFKRLNKRFLVVKINSNVKINSKFNISTIFLHDILRIKNELN